MFPFTLDGGFELALPHKLEGEIMDRIYRALVAKRANHIRCAGNRIGFRGGQFRAVRRGNPLSPITTGIITIKRNNDGNVRVQYHLTFWELFLTATVMVTLFFGPFVWQHFSSEPFVKLQILGSLWLWLYGANLVIVRFQFPWFLEDAIAPYHLQVGRNR